MRAPFVLPGGPPGSGSGSTGGGGGGSSISDGSRRSINGEGGNATGLNDPQPSCSYSNGFRDKNTAAKLSLISLNDASSEDDEVAKVCTKM